MTIWKETTLGEFIALQRGHDLTEPERRNGNVPVMGSAGQNGFHDTALAKGPGVVIGRSGASFGQIHYSKVDYWPHNTVLYITDFKGNDPKFVFYFLKGIDFSRYNSGSAQQSLNRNFIYPIAIQVPPLSGQKRIASILGSLDDKIELNCRQNETLEAMARALFQSWFVDFDPVMDNAIEAKKPIPAELTDKAARRKAAKGKFPALPKEIRKLFPNEFEPSPLGPIPKGWKAGILNDCIEIVGGGTPKTSECSFWEGDIPWFSVVDAPVDSDVFVIDTEKKITQAGLDNSSTKVLPERTTIISARGTVGKCAIVGCPMAFNQSCYGLLPKDGKHFYYVYFMTRSCVDILQQSGHGSVFNTITRNTFESINIVMSKEDALNVFEKRVESFLDKIKNNIYQSRVLGQLRDTLLPKLLSGEIKV